MPRRFLENIGWGTLALVIATYFALLFYNKAHVRTSVLERLARYVLAVLYVAVLVDFAAAATDTLGVQATPTERRTFAWTAGGWALAAIIPLTLWWRRRNHRLANLNRVAITPSEPRSIRWYVGRSLAYVFAVFVCADAILAGNDLNAALHRRLQSWTFGAEATGATHIARVALPIVFGWAYALTISGAFINILNYSLQFDSRVGRKWNHALLSGPYVIALSNVTLYPGLLLAAVTHGAMLYFGYRWTDDPPAGVLRSAKNLKHRRVASDLQAAAALPPGDEILHARAGRPRTASHHRNPLRNRTRVRVGYSRTCVVVWYDEHPLTVPYRDIAQITYVPPRLIKVRTLEGQTLALHVPDSPRQAALFAADFEAQYRLGRAQAFWT
jgi:hypothetical protein